MPNPAIWCIYCVATVNIIVPGKRALVRVTHRQSCKHKSRALQRSVSGAENGAERPQIQTSGKVGINERSAEREVAERVRSGERTESAAYAAKACTICTLHFSEAKRRKRGPGPGTCRLDFGGNPMTFLVCPIFTQMINRSHCVMSVYTIQ